MTAAHKKYFVIGIAVAGLLVIVAGIIGINAIPYLVMGDQGTSPLFFARTAEDAKSLIDDGANVNARSDYGFTPLHFAAARGDYEVVQFLLDHGADPTVRSHDGNTPLH
jgi:ankyrin repeat protein